MTCKPPDSSFHQASGLQDGSLLDQLSKTEKVFRAKCGVVRRLYILAAFLAVGFSIVWILPRSGDMKPSRLMHNLPMAVDGFHGQKTAVTGEELRILAKDTEFVRAQYVNLTKPHAPKLEASVVFSGKDINNSIHRAERCLRSQGWNFLVEKKVEFKNALADGSDLPLRAILCSKLVTLKDGREINVQRLQYYTFFGHETITESHYTRTFTDMKDRLFKGYDQQWAYATFSMPVTQVYADQGLIDSSQALNLEQTEQILEDFIRELAPLVIDQ